MMVRHGAANADPALNPARCQFPVAIDGRLGAARCRSGRRGSTASGSGRSSPSAPAAASTPWRFHPRRRKFPEVPSFSKKKSINKIWILFRGCNMLQSYALSHSASQRGNLLLSSVRNVSVATSRSVNHRLIIRSGRHKWHGILQVSNYRSYARQIT